MNCTQVRDLLDDFWYGETVDIESPALQLHIQQCSHCQAQFEQVRNMAYLLQTSLQAVAQHSFSHPNSLIWQRINSRSTTTAQPGWRHHHSNAGQRLYKPAAKSWIDIFEFPRPRPVLAALSFLFLMFVLSHQIQHLALLEYKKRQAAVQIEILKLGVLNYYQRYQCYPPSGDEVTTLFQYLHSSSSLDLVRFNVQAQRILDPWGQAYHYQRRKQTFVIFSYGPHPLNRNEWIFNR